MYKRGCYCTDTHKQFTKFTNEAMWSMAYSFHWVRKSRDEKNRPHSESDESITSSTQLKTHSFSWLNQLFKPQINNNEQEYIQSNKFDFELLHSFL
jgi:hypothetical protein